MENEKAQKLAEKIALLLQDNEKGSDDAALLRSSLEKINRRLDSIESQLTVQNPQSTIQNLTSAHPSQDKFVNIEELADEIIKNLQNEKACPYEPTGKPCDHCAMCSSRGF